MSPQRRHLSMYQRTMENFASDLAGDWFLNRIAPRIDPPLLRLTGGRVSSVYPTPAMLLTTTGAKSGQPRTMPLLYVADGDRLILMASNYGRTSHPAWYRNLVANPTVEVLAGKHSGTYTATEITDPPSVSVPGPWRSICTPATAITRSGRATGRFPWSGWSGRARPPRVESAARAQECE